nr:DinB family protein [Lysinibacillus timonensis]
MENNIKIREELWESVNGLTDKQLNKVVEDGKWSIAQVLEHLYLTEKLALQHLSNVICINETTQVKLRKIHLVEDRTQKVNAPSLLMPSDEYQTLHQLKVKLQSTREALFEKYNTLSEKELSEKAMPHPVFKFLTIGQWISFIGYHEKRHLGQIEEIKAALLT